MTAAPGGGPSGELAGGLADGDLPTRRFTGLVYRAHHPRWAFAPVSGEGAARHGGRFNPRGTPALYTSLDPTTAWMEAQQGLPFKAQPMTLVGYRVDCRPLLDLTAAAVQAAVGVGPDTLASAWEDLASRGHTPPTWHLARALIAGGLHGVLVPSFAPGARPDARNLVLWRWADTAPCAIRVIDDGDRLPRDAASWPADPDPSPRA